MGWESVGAIAVLMSHNGRFLYRINKLRVKSGAELLNILVVGLSMEGIIVPLI